MCSFFPCFLKEFQYRICQSQGEVIQGEAEVAPKPPVVGQKTQGKAGAGNQQQEVQQPWQGLKQGQQQPLQQRMRHMDTTSLKV